MQDKILLSNVLINYYVEGEGTPVILLHGNGESSEALFKLRDTLINRYKVYSLDSRSHGYSTSNHLKYSIMDMANDVNNFCLAKEINEVIVIGYSDGANIALALHKINPGLISKMVLISGNTHKKGILFGWRLLFKLIEIVNTPLGLFSNRALERKYKMRLMTKDIGVAREDLHNIGCPALVMVPKKDLIKYAHSQYIKNNIKNSLFALIEECNHFNIIENNECINDINDYLDNKYD